MPLSLATVTISVTGRHKSTIEAMSQETCQTGTLVGSRGMTTTADRNLYVLFCDMCTLCSVICLCYVMFLRYVQIYCYVRLCYAMFICDISMLCFYVMFSYVSM